MPDVERDGSIPVTLEYMEFVGDGGSHQTLRKLAVLGFGCEDVDPGRDIIRVPDGIFRGKEDGEVGNMKGWTAAEVKDLDGIKTIERPQQPRGQR